MPKRPARLTLAYAAKRREPGGAQLLVLGVIVFLIVAIGGIFGGPVLGPLFTKASLEARRAAATRSLHEIQDAATAPYYPNCRSAHEDGVYSLRRGEPGYRAELDADRDGRACEPLPKTGPARSP